MRTVLAMAAFIVVVAGCQREQEPLTSFGPESGTSDAHPIERRDGIFAISAHIGCIDEVKFSPDGKEIASCGMDQTVRIWNSQTGEYLRGFQSSERVLSVCYSPDGKMLAATTLDHGIHIWNTANWECSTVGRAREQPQVVSFSPDAKLLAVGTSPIQLFRVRDWKIIRESAAHEVGGDALAFSSDGKLLGSGNGGGFAKIWKLPQLHEQVSNKHDYRVDSVAFTADNTKFITTSVRRDDKTDTVEISVVNVSSGKVVKTILGETLQGHLYPTTRLAISPDDRFLVTLLRGEHDTGIVIDDVIQSKPLHSVSVWDLDSGELRAREVTQKDVYKVAFNPDCKTFAVARTDGHIEVSDVSTFIRENPPDKSDHQHRLQKE